MLREQLALGPFQCNCNILACEKTKEAVVIDPGGEAEKIIRLLDERGYKTRYLLHTHAHLDHVGATEALQQKTGGTVCLHRGDLFLYENVAMQAALFGLPSFSVPEVQSFLEDRDALKFGEYKVEVLHTPGHTPGSLTFLVDNGSEAELFTGDTLFMGSIGRTDLWGGDYNQILHSIKDKLMPLEDPTQVHPGHGPSTTMGKERARNPFLQDLD